MSPENRSNDEELRALCDAATPGPWVAREVDDGQFYGQPATFDIASLDGGREEVIVAGGFVEDGGPSLGAVEAPDAAFITAARTAVPSLLARLATVERERAEDANDYWLDQTAWIETRNAVIARAERAESERNAAVAENARLLARIAAVEALCDEIEQNLIDKGAAKTTAELTPKLSTSDVRAALAASPERTEETL